MLTPKRLLDIVLAGLLLLVFLPVGLVVALVLAVTGERRIFYAQTRIGRYGLPFRLFKFVTMLENSASMGTGTLTVPDDPRVLPVGKFLRKTKLNEVPQLWNVLRGDMSLVGPRPLTRQDFDCYPLHVQRRIIEIQPGLTGVGSLVFRDEDGVLRASKLAPLDCYRFEIAPRKGKLELWYVENQSLALDIKLLFLTAVAIVAPRAKLPIKAVEQALSSRALDDSGSRRR